MIRQMILDEYYKSELFYPNSPWYCNEKASIYG